MVEIYTDGGVFPNPGPGAWAFIVVAGPTANSLGQEIHRASGTDPSTTNNRMELMAVMQALRWFKGSVHDQRGEMLVVKSDSQLTVMCGMNRWRRNANQDLWAEFNQLLPTSIFRLQWVRGHAGDHWNEQADRMCTAAMEEAAALRAGRGLAELPRPMAPLLDVGSGDAWA